MLFPKITVITICFNIGNELEQTIKSVIGQSYPNIEYIIIDGGSTDDTMAVLKRYKDNISLIVSEPDKGVYDAMNKGVRLATGDYVNFMNGGDSFSNSEVLTTLFSDLANLDYDVVFGDTINCYGWGRVRKRGGYYNEHSIHMPFGHQSVFVRTNLLKANPFDLSYKIQADNNTMFSLYKQGYSFAHVSVDVADYDMYGLSNNVLGIYNEACRIHNITGVKYYVGYVKCRVLSFALKYLPEKFINTYQKIKYSKDIVDNQ